MSKQQGSADTREAILDATDRLLATRGFRGVTMDDIATEAGVSRRTVYMYFPTKEEVGLSSIDRVVTRTHEHLRAIAGRGGRIEVVLRTMLVERVLFRIDSVRAYRQSLDELFEAVRPAYMKRREQHMALEIEIFAEVLDKGRGRGRLVFDDAVATATVLLRATNAFLPYSLSVAELGARDDIEASALGMAKLLMRGLAAFPNNRP